MPYATDNKISRAPIEGGIEITDQQYADAREHTKTGIVKVVDGNMYLASRRPHDKAGVRVEFSTELGDWEVIEVPKPEYDEEKQSLTWDSEALDWVVTDLPDTETAD